MKDNFPMNDEGFRELVDLGIIILHEDDPTTTLNYTVFSQLFKSHIDLEVQLKIADIKREYGEVSNLNALKDNLTESDVAHLIETYGCFGLKIV